jgi:hypothetical protein
MLQCGKIVILSTGVLDGTKFTAPDSIKKKNSVVVGPQANYTDRAIAAGQRS